MDQVDQDVVIGDSDRNYDVDFCFLCMAIGMWIDKHFSTNLFLLFLILGIMGGIRGVYSLIHNILKQEDMEDKDER